MSRKDREKRKMMKSVARYSTIKALRKKQQIMKERPYRKLINSGKKAVVAVQKKHETGGM